MEIIEISNDGLKAVVYVKYYAEDIYNGNGNYTQYFELKYNGTSWYIVTGKNAAEFLLNGLKRAEERLGNIKDVTPILDSPEPTIKFSKPPGVK